MAFIDYYKILGVSKDIPQKDVKAAYRKRAKQFHPDLHPNDPKAKAKFQALNEAYAVISDPDKRAKYDKYGEHWRDAEAYENAGGQAGGAGGFSGFGGSSGGDPFSGFDFSSFGSGGSGFSSFFEDLFGHAGAGSGRTRSYSFSQTSVTSCARRSPSSLALRSSCLKTRRCRARTDACCRWWSATRRS